MKDNNIALKIIDQLFNGGNHTDRTLLKSKEGILNFLEDLLKTNRNGKNWKNRIIYQIEYMKEEEEHIIKLLSDANYTTDESEDKN